MLSILHKPYPFYHSKVLFTVIILLTISLASFTFSYVFEPFEVNRSEHKMDYFWICMIHATVPFVLGLMYFSVLNLFQKNEQKWTLGKEALHLSIFLFLVGLSSYFVRVFIYTTADNMSLRYLLEELKNTFLIGILLIAILLPLIHDRLLKKYESAAKTIEISEGIVAPVASKITIQSALASENFELDISSFVYAKVDGNYSDIYTFAKASLEKKMVRTSLKELELQLSSYPNILRTHRAYLVNTDYIQTVEGNAQGYVLQLSHLDDKIPVSRAKITDFNAHFSDREA